MSTESLPATKVLAIGKFTSPPTPAQFEEIMPREIPATLQLYLDGKMDLFWLVDGFKGVVFVMNTSSVDEAHAWLEALPLGQANLMAFEYTAIGPLLPLGFLIDGKLRNVSS